MFDIFPRALASVASVLFPIFASYKALQSADPAQLTPWLMYWVVLACVVLVESWTDWLLVWVPLYHYLRLFFLLYLVLPQTQGARVLYQTHVHPFLQHHESRIDDFIATAHDRLRAAGLAYLQQAIDYVRGLVGLPPQQTAAGSASAPSGSSSSSSSTSYTQSLLSRFTLPSARWPGGAGSAGAAGSAGHTNKAGSSTDIYSMLSSALGPAASSLSAASATSATQRDRLRSLLSALDRAAATAEGAGGPGRVGGSRSASGSSGGETDSAELRKSRSEADFVRIDADSSAEEGDGGLRQRSTTGSAAGSWMPWGWGGSGGGSGSGSGNTGKQAEGPDRSEAAGTSSGAER